jgi:hypothetical protein
MHPSYPPAGVDPGMNRQYGNPAVANDFGKRFCANPFFIFKIIFQLAL